MATGSRVAGGEGPRSPVDQTIDAIMEMAIQLPALKRIGEQIAESLDRGAAGSASDEKPTSSRQA
jgi:hypothetical protein